MILSDSQINVFVSKVLHLGQGRKKEYLKQVDFLIDRLKKKINEDSSFKVKSFKVTGSLAKGTVLKPKGDFGVDADIAVFLDVAEAEKDHVENLHEIIRNLLVAIYPSKKKEDFPVQPRTLGIHFLDSGLDVDLVPVIPIAAEPGYGWQPSSDKGEPVKTNIQGQLDYIKAQKKSDVRFKTLVRLLKKWRNENELDKLRSFTIELILAHLNEVDGPATSYEAGLQRFFLYVAQSKLQSPIAPLQLGKIVSFPSSPVVILDPVNKNNNVAKRVTDPERQEIVDAAQKAWETIVAANWKDTKGETLDLWKEVMGRSFTVDED